MNENPRVNTLVISDTPDSIDYAKLVEAGQLAASMGCSVVVHDICHECASVTTVPPSGPGYGHTRCTFLHDDWCPVLAHHQGRQLTPAEQRRHRRYMDTR